MDTAAANLYERIQSHFAAGLPVAVATWTRMTVYQPKHAALFVAAKSTESGVYVRRGRRMDYVLPEYVKFGRIAS